MTDTNPENKNISSTTDSAEEPPKKTSKKLFRILVFISIILLLCIVAFSFYLYQKNAASNALFHQKINNLTTELNNQSAQQKTAVYNVKKQNEKLVTQVEQLNIQLLDVINKNKLYSSDIDSLRRNIAEKNIRQPNDWILSEVEYLINLSGRKLWLEHDLTSSIALLSAADQRIVEMKDPSLNPLRRALLEDINMLEGLPHRDLDKVVLSLSSLERRIEQLVIFGLEMPETKKNEDNLSADINDWKSNLNKSWNTFLEGFIVVSHRDEPIEALLSPEQAWYLKENLRNHLARAEFAVYREQQNVYDNAMKSAKQLLEAYYDMTDQHTQQFLDSVKKLSDQKVSVTYPDQFNSAPLLSRIVKQRLDESFMTDDKPE